MSEFAEPKAQAAPQTESAAPQISRKPVAMGSERSSAARQIQRSLKAWRSEEGEEKESEAEGEAPAAAEPEAAAAGGDGGAPPPAEAPSEGESEGSGKESEEQAASGGDDASQAADGGGEEKKVSAKRVSRKIFRDPAPGAAGGNAPSPEETAALETARKLVELGHSAKWPQIDKLAQFDAEYRAAQAGLKRYEATNEQIREGLFLLKTDIEGINREITQGIDAKVKAKLAAIQYDGTMSYDEKLQAVKSDPDCLPYFAAPELPSFPAIAQAKTAAKAAWEQREQELKDQVLNDPNGPLNYDGNRGGGGAGATTTPQPAGGQPAPQAQAPAPQAGGNAQPAAANAQQPKDKKKELEEQKAEIIAVLEGHIATFEGQGLAVDFSMSAASFIFGLVTGPVGMIVGGAASLAVTIYEKRRQKTLAKELKDLVDRVKASNDEAEIERIHGELASDLAAFEELKKAIEALPKPDPAAAGAQGGAAPAGGHGQQPAQGAGGQHGGGQAGGQHGGHHGPEPGSMSTGEKVETAAHVGHMAGDATEIGLHAAHAVSEHTLHTLGTGLGVLGGLVLGLKGILHMAHWGHLKDKVKEKKKIEEKLAQQG